MGKGCVDAWKWGEGVPRWWCGGAAGYLQAHLGSGPGLVSMPGLRGPGFPGCKVGE